MLRQLRLNELPEALQPSSIREYNVNYVAEKGIDPENPDHKQYLKNLTEDFVSEVTQLIEKNLARRPRQSGLYEEVFTHNKYAQDKRRLFVGRTEWQDKVVTYLTSPSQSPIYIVYGSPGCGKSAFMAQCVQLALTHCPLASVVCRFVGLTSESSQIGSLLSSLLEQIYGVTGASRAIPTDLRKLKQDFLRSLQLFSPTNPLVLIIDALDQLAWAGLAREVDMWLPVRTGNGVKLIVSCNPDPAERVFPVLRRHIFGQAGFEQSFLPLSPLSSDEAGMMLQVRLDATHRALSKEQRDAMTALFGKCMTPLFVALSFQQSLRWASYTADFKSQLVSLWFLSLFVCLFVCLFGW